jgi:hypothetical protein
MCTSCDCKVKIMNKTNAIVITVNI